MNHIPILQNSQKQLERLAAQRELYSSAKKYYSLQLIGNVLIPIVLSLGAIFCNSIAVYAALYGVCFFIFDILIIDPTISLRKTKAAKIQELFDCEILYISQSPLKTANDITVEEVLTHYNAHQKIQTNIENLKNWYPSEVGSVPIEVARLICQRTNCWWDAKLRISYCNLLKFVSVLSSLLLIILGILGHLSFEEVVLISSALIPFFQFTVKQLIDNSSSSERLGKLGQFINNNWEQLLNHNLNENDLKDLSRPIQDEIYENRIASPLILDWFYKFFRTKDEEIMSKTADILVREYFDSL